MAGGEGEKSWLRRKAEGAAMFLGEASMVVTVPLAVYAVVSGAAVGLGLASLAVDGAEYWAIEKYKNKSKEQKTVFEANAA